MSEVLLQGRCLETAFLVERREWRSRRECNMKKFWYKATWEMIFRLTWREAGAPKFVGSDQ